MNVVEPIRDLKQIEAVKIELMKKSYKYYIMFILGINSGLRVSDILNRKVCDVRGKAHITMREQKTGKEKRFPLNVQLREEIERYTQGMNDEAVLIPSNKGGAVGRKEAYKVLNKAAKSVGITDAIGSHSLRKSFGYHHYKQNHDVAMLMQIFNHTSQSQTLRYIGITADEIDKSYNNFYL